MMRNPRFELTSVAQRNGWRQGWAACQRRRGYGARTFVVQR
jgi:hypothetical protein